MDGSTNSVINQIYFILLWILLLFCRSIELNFELLFSFPLFVCEMNLQLALHNLFARYLNINYTGLVVCTTILYGMKCECVQKRRGTHRIESQRQHRLRGVCHHETV